MLSDTEEPCPAAKIARTCDSSELPGSQTTSSGRSATSTGKVIEPRSVETFAQRRPFAVVAETRATAGRAVPARCGSSTCNEPSSSNCRQVANTALPDSGVFCEPNVTSGSLEGSNVTSGSFSDCATYAQETAGALSRRARSPAAAPGV